MHPDTYFCEIYNLLHNSRASGSQLDCCTNQSATSLATDHLLRLIVSPSRVVTTVCLMQPRGCSLVDAAQMSKVQLSSVPLSITVHSV
jgi:hypothetical protein